MDFKKIRVYKCQSQATKIINFLFRDGPATNPSKGEEIWNLHFNFESESLFMDLNQNILKHLKILRVGPCRLCHTLFSLLPNYITI